MTPFYDWRGREIPLQSPVADAPEQQLPVASATRLLNFPSTRKHAMKRLYIVWDKLAQDAAGTTGVFPIIAFAHDAAAVRYFSDICRDKQTAIAQHPADYELHCIGSWDPRDNQQLTPMARPIVVVTGEAVLAAQEPK